MLVVEEETSITAQEEPDMSKADEDDFSVHIRIDTKTLVIEMQRRIDGFTKKMLSDDMKKMSAEMYADYVKPYVPKGNQKKRLTTELRNVSIEPYRGTYAVVYDPEDIYGHHYAAAQYYGDNGSNRPESLWKRHTEGTHSYWNRHLKTAERQAMYDDLADLFISELNGNG